MKLIEVDAGGTYTDIVHTETETRHSIMHPLPTTSHGPSRGRRIVVRELGVRCAPKVPRPQKILVVEDMAFNQDLLVQLLEDDYEVCTASDGAEGIRMAERERPDLILMDLALPGIDGWEATRRLKANATLHTIPIIALSAHAMRGDEAKALQSGCDAYLSKPFDENLLFATLARFLGE